jgi:hypothetical protein
MLWIVTTKLIAARIAEIPTRCRPRIHASMPCPPRKLTDDSGA